MPEVRSARASLTDTITSLRTLTNPTAYVSRHKVELNGAKANLAAYTINGSNYFKLRDLAAALKGLDSEFAVTWNAAQQRIDLTSKTAYTPVGGEQAALPAGNKAASLTSAAVYLDGKPLSLTAYSIGGNNYFKLRDLAKALDGLNTNFEVKWNAAQQRIDLTSKTAYTAVGGEQAALPAGNKAASLTNASVYLDGKPLNLTAYSIGGNNYFKLRDLGDALGFGVDWDNATSTVTISAQ